MIGIHDHDALFDLLLADATIASHPRGAAFTAMRYPCRDELPMRTHAGRA